MSADGEEFWLVFSGSGNFCARKVLFSVKRLGGARKYFMASYSGTPLAKKLGIKETSRAKTRNAPDNYLQLVTPHPINVSISDRIRKDIDIFYFFTRSRSELSSSLPKMMSMIRQNGMVWVSWPKKTSGVKTDVTEGVFRKAALPLGLVDVKVCAVDETWSGLKLVIRKELRK